VAVDPTARPQALVFDTFGTVVDWRGSLIAELTDFGRARGIQADWARLVDEWRAAYGPSMARVRRGELGWTPLDVLHRLSLDRLVDELGIVGLSEADLVDINLGWHRLAPWPDAAPGLARLKRHFIIGPLSNGNVSLLVDLARFGNLPWDVVFGADLFEHYKPDPETYLGACSLLGLEPSQVMMVAAHNGDLASARALGLRTAFFPRPVEYGPHHDRDLAPAEEWDVVATDIEDLAAQLGA
jgi:2-haloacid dehalogenase